MGIENIPEHLGEMIELERDHLRWLKKVNAEPEAIAESEARLIDYKKRLARYKTVNRKISD